MNKYTDTITFKTTKKCPEDFDFWTFFWSYPKIDKDASLEYIVHKPNGKVYYHWKAKDHSETVPNLGTLCQSDFSADFAGGNPKCFYNKEVSITFMVTKGKIEFDQNEVENFKFRFSKTIKAIEI